MMVMIGTTIVLALWLLFVWFVDPDDFHRGTRRRLAYARHSNSNRY